MKKDIDPGVEEREPWRDRLLRSLAELRATDNAKRGRVRRDERAEEGAPSDAEAGVRAGS